MRKQEMLKAMKEQENKFAQENEGLFSYLLSGLHPYIKESVQYNDNIYLVQDGQKSDLINIINPGIKFIAGRSDKTLESAERLLELDAGTEVYNYINRTTLNRQLLYVSLSSHIGKGSNRFLIKQSFDLDAEPASLLSTGRQDLVDFSETKTKLGWEKDFNRVGIGLGYSRYAALYSGDFKATNTYDDQTVGVVGYLNPPSMPKTKFLLELEHGIFTYTKDVAGLNNYDYDRVWVGAKGKLASKTTGLVKFGYEKANFSGTHPDSVAVKINVDYKYSPRTTFTLDANQGQVESANRAEGFSDESSVALKLVNNLNRRLSLKGGLSYTLDKYKTSGQDKTYGGTAGLQYLFHSWLMANLDYEYNQKDSSFANNSYKNNIFTLKLGAEF